MQNKQDFYKKVIETYFHIDSKKNTFNTPISEGELKKTLKLGDDLREGNMKEEDIFHYLEKYITYSVKTDHPQFLNRMWTGANPAGISGEIVGALQQVSACTYMNAPVSTLMEKYMISTMLKIVGFNNGEGQMTTGSSNANMIAMMTARNLHSKKTKKQGLFESEQLFAFVNEESHYSLDKAANILGIGSDNLIKVPANNLGEMDTGELENLLEKYSGQGKNFFVAATAGTTVRGAYDNISNLLELREKYHFWLHVDGAWGGPVFLSETLREVYLKDIEKVDSFTFDFHKMPGVALICNMLLINERKGILEHNCQGADTNYIFEGQDEYNTDEGDLGLSSLQCGRRVDSLKLFLDWKYYGQKGFAKKMERYLSLCEYAQKVVEKHDMLEMSFERPSFNVCFTYRIENRQESNRVNERIRTGLYEQGLSLVGSATIDGIFFLRLLICNDEVQEKDVDTFFENVVNIGDTITKNKEAL